jgi:membrane-bound serine protease (ClpP class)
MFSARVVFATLITTLCVSTLRSQEPIENPFDLLPKADQQPVDDEVLQGEYRRAIVIDFDGPIFGSNQSYLNNRLDRAKREGVDLIIIRLTSPGGDMQQSLTLGNRLRDINWAKTIAFIPREAISGGAIIALGCERIYMLPRAILGDAGPIRMDPNGQFQHAEEKIVSYLSTAVRELALSKGRPGAIAEAMVDRNLKVFTANEKESGKTSYLTEAESQDPKILARYTVGPALPEAGANRFLTISGSRATELGMANGTFEDENELMKALNIETVVQTKINWVDKLVFLLNRPWITVLLLLAGLIGLYIEMAAPGISVAGFTSAVCFVIFFWSHALGGTSGWLEVLLFLLGVAAIFIELFVLPGTTLFGISGLLLVLLSLVMATQDFFLPETKFQWQQLRTNTLIVMSSVLLVGIFFLVQLFVLDSIPGLKRFQLAAPVIEANLELADSPNSLQPSGVGMSLPQVGEIGVAESVLRPSGKVMFGDQLLDVISDGDYIDAGTPVEIVRREGIRITVRKTIGR